MIIRFRLFNDGLGFSLQFPEQKNLTYFVVKKNVPSSYDWRSHRILDSGDYDTQEYDFTESKLTEIRKLFRGAVSENASQNNSQILSSNVFNVKTADGIYINIHEAALINYSCMHLNLDDKNLVFQSHLTPDSMGNKGHLQAPCVSPWRTIIVKCRCT